MSRQLLLLLIFIFVFSFSTTGAIAQSFSLSVDPPIVHLLVKPGKTVRQTYTLLNVGDPTTVTVSVTPFTPRGSSGNVTLVDCNRIQYYSCTSTSWFTILPSRSLFLRKNASAKLQLKMEVPFDAEERDYYLSLVFSALAPRSQSDSGVGVSGQIVSNTLISVSETGRTEMSGRLEDLQILRGSRVSIGNFRTTIVDSFADIPVRLVVKNTGTHSFDISGRLTLKTPFLPESQFTLLPKTILASSSRLMQVENATNDSFNSSLSLPASFYLGPNTLKASITLQNLAGSLSEEGKVGKQPQLEAQVTFLAIPIKVLTTISIIGLLGLLFFRRRKKHA